MKLFKSTLFIVALFAIGSVAAKRKGATAPTRGRAASSAAQAPTQEAAERPFSYYVTEVRKMPANQVIDADGVFTDKFENFVKFSGLEPKCMRALMSIGASLYLPLTGDNDQDVETLMHAIKRMDSVMASMQGAGTGPDWEGRTEETIVTDLPMPVRRPKGNPIWNGADVKNNPVKEENLEPITLPMPQRNPKVMNVTDDSIRKHLDRQLASVNTENLLNADRVSNLIEGVKATLKVTNEARIRPLVEEAMEIRRQQLRRQGRS